jgi:two-component system OmpR family sensor kinase
MASVRSRITAAYGIAMVGAMAAFAAVIGVQRRNFTRQRLLDEASNTAAFAGAIIERQSVPGVIVDTVGAAQALPPSVTSLLDALPGYLIISDSAGNTLYRSRAVRRFRDLEGNFQLLPEARRAAGADLEILTQVGNGITSSSSARIVQLSGDEVLLVASLHQPPLRGGVARIVAGVTTSRIGLVTSEVAGLSALVAPVLILAAMGIAWVLAGRVLEPINQMVDDVAAIRDGRSLHRRVVLDGEERSDDELKRLGRTVNDMVARLESSFASLRRFTADASHELRTPLAVIRADVERAMADKPGSHDQAVALEEALQQVSRMTALVESLLTLARADEGRFDLVREPVAMEPLVREVVETAQILGEEAGITVTVPIVQAVTVHGDSERLRQLLLNLVTNAIKYTARGGHVELSLEARHDEAIVAVKDDGIGIAAADLPLIFDRFWRVDRVRSRTEGGGSGLGLAICQWIAQAHDGRIDVTSRLGRGSTFTVILPALDKASAIPNTALSNS